MPKFPQMTPIIQGSRYGGGLPGIYVINFDPTVAGNAGMLKGIEQGSLLVQIGTLDVNCVQACATGVYVLVCHDCDVDPTVVSLTTSTISGIQDDIIAALDARITALEGP